MPFFKRDIGGGTRVVDRTQTGGYAPPEPGRVQTEDGTIVGSLSENTIPSGTEVKVNLPGPREPLFDARGNVSPRWYRFFLELYRRTGGPNDNVNFTPALRNLPLSPQALSIAGAAPTVQIVHTKEVPVASLSLSSEAPTIP